MANPSTFVGLPTEITTQVVTELVNDPCLQLDRFAFRSSYSKKPIELTLLRRGTRHQLKNLRLTHRRFSNMDCINALLFDSVQFEASRAGLLNLEKCDMSRIASFVSIITFMNPPSWKLPFETLEQILIETIPKGEPPVTESQLASAYASYIRHARDSQFSLEDPESELRSLWTKTLKLLGRNLRDVRRLSLRCDELCQVDYTTYLRKADEGISYQLGPHHHADRVVEYGCRYAAAIAGDQLFSTVISCLSASGIAVPQISIKHAMTGTIDCTKLEFGPDIPHDEDHWASKSVLKALPCPKVEEIESHASRIVHELVNKSRTTLKRLVLDGSGVLDWPTQPPVASLPALESFNHSFDAVNPIVMSSWLKNMPNLRYLKLGGIRLSRGLLFVEWRHIFDAVRDHRSVGGPNPKGLSVEFESIKSAHWTRMTYRGVICQDSTIATGRHTHCTDPEGLMDENYSLEKHFYNEMRFKDNHGLRYLMNDWDVGMVETDSEEDEEGGESENWDEDSEEEKE
ncbi:hypothetical protein FOC4_g10005836 [Fusarium odoratissimum]|uniref:Uncharacterized protein n=2 Tax=Fusarium oxysporum species complex TaxID=171631 RepID=N1RMA4_FUSC4|nr:hypothetical protein FOC4_g10005836 [Fusarium odoratissimum]TXB95948.1 hypothetical protein FocTR4_00015918 [Fusarium oxysporum f. sp. cubense]